MHPVEEILRKSFTENKNILLEGAQGCLLDLVHGTYPYVTSSVTNVGGAVSSIGFDPRLISDVIGIAKAYLTRVGEGPFPTEQKNTIGSTIAEKGAEFGSTTLRPRRCGWFDCVSLRYANMINGFNKIFLNKIDILTGFKELKIATSYKHPKLGTIKTFPNDPAILSQCTPIYKTLPGWSKTLPKTGTLSDLPREAQTYIKAIEEHCGISVSYIGTGPKRNDYITCN